MSIRRAVSQRPWLLALLVAGVVSLWMLSGMLDRRANGPGTAPVNLEASTDVPASRVQVVVQTAKPITRSIRVNGRSAPARSVQIKAETDGRVEAINADRGERVQRGQEIMRLDLRDRVARLEQARASVNEHRTAYEGQQQLKTEGYVSDTQIAETLANLEAARAELKRAELDLAHREIRAPFDGVIQDRSVELGDFVRSGDPVVDFVDNTRIIVTGTVSEQDARYVKIGMLAEARLITGQTVQGKIRYLAPVADEATRTFTVEMEVPNPDGSLPAGVTAEMRIPGGEMLAHRISPSLLTLDDAGKLGVKTVNQYNQVEFYPVEIARTDPDGVWVSGLPETTEIIVLGQGYVDVGAEVEPVNAERETALAADKLQ